MAVENSKDAEKMGLFVQGPSEDIRRRIEETEKLLANTSRFLDNIAQSQAGTRAYIQDVLKGLTDKLDYLKNQKTRADDQER